MSGNQQPRLVVINSVTGGTVYNDPRWRFKFIEDLKAKAEDLSIMWGAAYIVENGKMTVWRSGKRV